MLTLLTFNSANAEYLGNQIPSKIFGSSTIKFGINTPPNDVCSYFTRHFIFDATTDKGKNMLAILLAAKMGNRSINIWYSPSTTPGKDHNSGCTLDTLATVHEIGIN